jgi:hypothetical protein
MSRLIAHVSRDAPENRPKAASRQVPGSVSGAGALGRSDRPSARVLGYTRSGSTEGGMTRVLALP